jgi:ABC-type Co2+ transport system permease subunit
MLTCMSKMPWKRLVAGGLLGVCMTPFVMSGAWVLYHALAPAGPWFSVPVALLWLAAYPIGAFIHGSFIYFGGSVHGWNAATGEIKAQLGDILYRMLRVLLFSYVVFFALAIATSVWYVVAVLQGTTALPTWMAIMNPALMTVVYMFLARRVIPFRVIKYVQGTGFNIVYIVFFALLLAFVW